MAESYTVTYRLKSTEVSKEDLEKATDPMLFQLALVRLMYPRTTWVDVRVNFPDCLMGP